MRIELILVPSSFSTDHSKAVPFVAVLLSFCLHRCVAFVLLLYFYITKTCLYNFDPLKPHFYMYKVKLGFTGVYIIFLISAQKHRLWVLVRTASSIYVLRR